jgi:glutamate-1-semialdehyde 2,1-aminomutase
LKSSYFLANADQERGRFPVSISHKRRKHQEINALRSYLSKTTNSKRMYQSARNVLAGGQSHNARFFKPYPFYAARARGKYIWDVDNNRYVDYWMGHTALILGHSPRVVSNELRKQVGNGLLLGAPNKFAVELAELVSACVPCAESVRFCTSGAEATMYATRLARAYTKKKTVVKIAGGWHGYSSTLAVGVRYPYEISESAGLVDEDEQLVKLAKFNEIQGTSEVLEECSSDLAAVILEPVLGAGGALPAEKEYLESLREQCYQLGALLIFDEIITGFRLALGGAQEFYSIKPDLCTLGKILGGGLPASALVGRSDILSLTDMTVERPKEERCWIGGGTFSEHALSMRAGIATLKELRARKKAIYSSIGNLGRQLREGVDQAFRDEGIRTKTTGEGSLFATHFLKADQDDIKSPQDVVKSDEKTMREYYFSLIASHGIYFIPGHIGAISTAHSQSDITHYIKSTAEFASALVQSRKSTS